MSRRRALTLLAPHATGEAAQMVHQFSTLPVRKPTRPHGRLARAGLAADNPLLAAVRQLRECIAGPFSRDRDAPRAP